MKLGQKIKLCLTNDLQYPQMPSMDNGPTNLTAEK